MGIFCALSLKKKFSLKEPNIEAIILAGGFGTRLQSVVKDVPKPMADIRGKPFLEYLLMFLAKSGFSKVILSVGYKKEVIMDYFKDFYLGMEIIYSPEESPLGTGGAIKKALMYAIGENVLVLNGDTFFNLDITSFYATHQQNTSSITMALKPMTQFDRYGSVNTSGKTVVSFEEKGFKEKGLINAGAYIIRKSIQKILTEFNDVFSFEKDFLEKNISTIKPVAYIEDAYFIDIGIPEDYNKAQQEL